MELLSLTPYFVEKILNVYIHFLSLPENWDSIAGNDPRNENYPTVGRRLSCEYRRFRNELYSGMCCATGIDRFRFRCMIESIFFSL